MNPQSFIAARADSLMELLAQQCADLEALLNLARSETGAVENRDFEAVLQITGERARLGERLEVYHRQIAEMRTQMSERALLPVLGSEVARRTARLAADIQAQDERTRPLLLAARHETAQQLTGIEQSRRSIGAYLRDSRPLSVACDQRA